MAALDQWEKSEKKILTLDPLIQLACKDHIARCASEGIYVIVTEAVRDAAYQRTLYAKGRDANGKVVEPGKVVTYAPPGFSVHEYKLAYDLAIDGVTEEGKEFGLTAEESLIDGKVRWPEPRGKALGLWKRVAACGEAVGMRSGSTFLNKEGKPFPDWPHFEWLGPIGARLTIAELSAGKRPTTRPGEPLPGTVTAAP